MTDKRIVWEMPDGLIAVTVPAPKGRMPGESESDWLERIANKAKPPGAKRLPDVLVTELPDRTKRHAWRRQRNTTKVVIDPSVPEPARAVPMEEEITALKARLKALEGRQLNRKGI